MTDRSIVTLNQVKQYLALNTSNTEHDTLLDGSEDGTIFGLIALVSEEFESEIDNKVQPYDYEEIMSGNGKSEIAVRFWPVIDIYGSGDGRLDNIQYRVDSTSAWVNLLTNFNYVWLDSHEPWKIKLLGGDGFPSGKGNLRIKYNAGYSTIPSDIQLAITERVTVKFLESKRGGARLGVTAGGVGGSGASNFSYTDHQGRWDSVVAKYRKWL